MENRPTFLPGIIAVVAIVVGASTAFAPHDRWGLRVGGLIAIYVVCGAVMVVAAGLQIWVWTRKGKQLDKEAIGKVADGSEQLDQRRQFFLRLQEKWKDDLDKPEDCPASDCKSKGHVKKRREFYRPLDPDKIRLPMLCSHCFKRLFSVWPQIQHQRLRVWKDNFPCSVPSCSEDAVDLGADDNPYCNGHMHKGEPAKDAVIT